MERSLLAENKVEVTVGIISLVSSFYFNLIKAINYFFDNKEAIYDHNHAINFKIEFLKQFVYL